MKLNTFPNRIYFFSCRLRKSQNRSYAFPHYRKTKPTKNFNHFHHFTIPKTISSSGFPPIYRPMKRSLAADDATAVKPDEKLKKVKVEGENETGFMNLDENLLYEVLKHVDARSLAAAACVSKQWHKTAKDERLWELICTRHWANIGCGNQQLRSVVLPLGGFRRLHSLYLWPLSKPQSSAPTTSAWAPFPAMIGSKPPARWGKDEVHLSLSLLSIRYYEKMNFSKR